MGVWRAISLCGSFWIVNFVMFLALGSVSNTHAALFIIAFVSLFILRWGARTAEAKQLATKAG